MKGVKFIGCILLCAVAGTAIAEDSVEPQVWLERMSEALRTLNFDGTFVYMHDGQMHAMRIIQSADEQGKAERLVSLTGHPREVIRDADLVTCILPDSKSVVVETSRSNRGFPMILPTRLDELERHYTFAAHGEDRVAGRVARKFAIQPRDGYRYGYELWLDVENHLLLKANLVNEQGEAVEQFMFTELQVLDQVPAALMQPSVSGKEYAWHRQKETKADSRPERSPWQVSALPEGFSLEVHRKNYLSTSMMPVEHMVFTDGLSSVSVFIEEQSLDQEPIVGRSRMGAVNAYSRVVAEHQVTVVGEVPAATVRMIGESIAPTPDAE
ncbi:MucB/RseB C-terminal domain-containing protein [Ectothiorhodospiraceae bacterium 2226]|nr:MucB/RseB C-terminal domain-containing protein [Ectothiorhodospiraceae bacterium 2226]